MILRNGKVCIERHKKKNNPGINEVFKSQIKKARRKARSRAQPWPVERELIHCEATPKL